MRIKKRVMEIVGESVKKHEFFYEKEYSNNIIWVFKREKGELCQRILIQKHRFCKELMLRFRPTAYVNPEIDAQNIVPPGRYQNHITEEARKMCTAIGYDLSKPKNLIQPMWFYDNEEDVRGILEEFVDVIEKYGLDKLEELSIEEANRIIPTEEMNEKLYASHDELCQKFIKEYGISVEQRSEDDIRKWFKIIFPKMQEKREEPYENVQYFLVEVAAFLGKQLAIVLEARWKKWETDPYTVLLQDLKCYLISRYQILNIVVETWVNQKFARLEEEFVWMCKAKLPLTEEQTIQLAEEFRKLPH